MMATSCPRPSRSIRRLIANRAFRLEPEPEPFSVLTMPTHPQSSPPAPRACRRESVFFSVSQWFHTPSRRQPPTATAGDLVEAPSPAGSGHASRPIASLKVLCKGGPRLTGDDGHKGLCYITVHDNHPHPLRTLLRGSRRSRSMTAIKAYATSMPTKTTLARCAPSGQRGAPSVSSRSPRRSSPPPVHGHPRTAFAFHSVFQWFRTPPVQPPAPSPPADRAPAPGAQVPLSSLRSWR